MATRLVEKVHLSAKGLIAKVRNVFKKVKEPLKGDQGYHFEHNFGHGYKHLSTVFAMLMMMAFLIDQTEQFCCGLFQGALKKLKSKKSRLWRRVRGFFEFHVVVSWEALYRAIVQGTRPYAQVIDTS